MAGTNSPNLEAVGLNPKDLGLQVAVVTIDPGLAKDWLSLNRGNRREKPQMVARYTRDITEGRWMLTGETIIFDAEGHLRNGQNRLRACVEADMPFDVLVVNGIDPAAFKVMDTGAARTYADALSIWNPDMQSYTALGATAAMVWRWENGKKIVGGGQAVNPTHAEVVDTMLRHPRLDRSVEVATRGGRNAVIRPPRVAAYLHYRFSLDDPELADVFFGRLLAGRQDPETGEFQVIGEDGQPIESLSLLLRTLKRMEAERSHRDAHKVLSYAFKTWRVWRGVDPMPKMLRVTQTEYPGVPITPEGEAWAWGENTP